MTICIEWHTIFPHEQEKLIKFYKTITSKEPFLTFLSKISKEILYIITDKLELLEKEGHFGDHKNLGGGLSEIRIFS